MATLPFIVSIQKYLPESKSHARNLIEDKSLFAKDLKRLRGIKHFLVPGRFLGTRKNPVTESWIQDSAMQKRPAHDHDVAFGNARGAIGQHAEIAVPLADFLICMPRIRRNR
jgi:hypothetical protein